eukprot:UN24886
MIDRNNKFAIVSNYVKYGQTVFVKCIHTRSGRIGLNYMDVDQKTGEDLRPVKTAKSVNSDRNKPTLYSRNKRKRAEKDDDSDEESKYEADRKRQKKRRKKVADEDHWVLKQMGSAGTHVLLGDEQEETQLSSDSSAGEELDIEINEEEPSFLQGQTHLTNDLDSVKVVKNPDGSMTHSAMIQAALAVERRDLRLQKKNMKQLRCRIYQKILPIPVLLE